MYFDPLAFSVLGLYCGGMILFYVWKEKYGK